MLKSLLLFGGLFFAQLVSAQLHDNVWLFGGGGGSQSPPNDSFGITLLDFGQAGFPQIFNRQDIEANFKLTNASFCDSTGNLLFYSNGERVYSRNHQVMNNGYGLVVNGTGWGYRVPQAALALPYPGHLNQYKLITVEIRIVPGNVFGWNLFSHTIGTALNGGLGAVAQKRILLTQDTMSYGMLTATKHANGRDWWILLPKYSSDVYHRGLLSPDGIQMDTFKTCLKIKDGLGQAVFSPDGSKYIRTEDDDLLTPNQISIFDFDRCEGKLYNCRTKFYDCVDCFGMGCAVSPDSRYLYVMATYEVLQYDLTADDIFATEQVVATWDGSRYYGIWPVDFYLGQLGPDGRIYVTTTNSSVSMHYVNFPNRPGSGCRFKQNGIWTPTVNQIGMPNLPNYRLGPVDGSACDTLGIDNHPLCNWRWEQEDTAQSLQITFTDLSAYEPDTWYWSFGDGASSHEASPIHTYAHADSYWVCLTVSNANSADTLCRWVNVGVSSLNEGQTDPFEVLAWPNPTASQLVLGLKGLDYLHGVATLYDLTGKQVAAATWNGPQLVLDIGHLPPGMYFYRVRTDKGASKTGKVMKY